MESLVVAKTKSDTSFGFAAIYGVRCPLDFILEDGKVCLMWIQLLQSSKKCSVVSSAMPQLHIGELLFPCLNL